MPRAGWCDVENTWVWVNDDGSCINGHGPEHVSQIYDTDAGGAPPTEPPAGEPVQPPVYPPMTPGQQPPPAPAAGTGAQQPGVPPTAYGGAPGGPGYGGAGYGGGYGTPTAGPPPSNKGTVALVLGIASILCCLPIITIPAGIAAIIFGVQGLKTTQRGLAIAGIVLGVLGILAGIVNAIFGIFATFLDPEMMRQLQQGQPPAFRY